MCDLLRGAVYARKPFEWEKDGTKAESPPAKKVKFEMTVEDHSGDGNDGSGNSQGL
jgi:hypothetical protein